MMIHIALHPWLEKNAKKMQGCGSGATGNSKKKSNIGHSMATIIAGLFENPFKVGKGKMTFILTFDRWIEVKSYECDVD